MGKLKTRKPKSDLTRPVTLGDLEALVRALGAIVGVAVEKAVRDGVAPELARLDHSLARLAHYIKPPNAAELDAHRQVRDEQDRAMHAQLQAERDLGPGNAVR